ncbi:MAG: hypothetical protein AAF512_18290 [Pseudomonadota bacterium]
MSEVAVDREFAEKFLKSVDQPLKYGVYFLFHEWWEQAPQQAIDEYLEGIEAIPGAKAFIAEGYLPEPIPLSRIARCAPGTLGHSYHKFIVDNNLEANLARNYRDFNKELHASGKLDRLPEDMSYMMLRGFQIHDFMHI